MSHTVYAYPKATEYGLTLLRTKLWAVREDEDDESRRLLDLTDAITERLAKSEALTRLFQGCREDLPDGTLADAALAIADLIHETRALYAEQWVLVRQAIFKPSNKQSRNRLRPDN